MRSWPGGQTILGARPVLARCARSAPPMPPDPVGQLERSRARPPPHDPGGPSGARALRALRCSDAPRPTPARLRRAQRERSRARPPLSWGPVRRSCAPTRGLPPHASTSRLGRPARDDINQVPTPSIPLGRKLGRLTPEELVRVVEGFKEIVG